MIINTVAWHKISMQGEFNQNYCANLLKCCLSLSSSSRPFLESIVQLVLYQEQSMVVVDKSFPITPSALKPDNLFNRPPIIQRLRLNAGSRFLCNIQILQCLLNLLDQVLSSRSDLRHSFSLNAVQLQHNVHHNTFR